MRHQKLPSVYVLASARRGTLYIGVTSDLVKRIWEHRNDLVAGFTREYGVHRLVYFEFHQRMQDAIQREKRLKKWNRLWKIELIENDNPEWRDLWDEIVAAEEGGSASISRHPRESGDPLDRHPRESGDPCCPAEHGSPLSRG
jgi:putative endonuclease